MTTVILQNKLVLIQEESTDSKINKGDPPLSVWSEYQKRVS